MKSVIQFLKTTMVGGLLVVLPVWLTVLLLLKAIQGAVGVLRPIAALLPQQVVHADLVALALLLLICFLTGLLLHASAVQRFGQWAEAHILDRVPGYSLLRGMTRQFAGQSEEQPFRPALIELEDALVPAFIVEKHADGRYTVFVSSSPTPMAGAIYILPPERVHPVDVPLATALVSITKWGTGTGQWLAAQRPK
ncbi:MAG: hypothetical protein PCFJNLEI_02553 [Verrucomicrobiae bacterium]|nr:hypothetical protein [Verrucomicrobiae bacterium]